LKSDGFAQAMILILNQEDVAAGRLIQVLAARGLHSSGEQAKVA